MVNANSGTGITKKRLREIFLSSLPSRDTDTSALLHFHLSPIALLPPHLFFMASTP